MPFQVGIIWGGFRFGKGQLAIESDVVAGVGPDVAGGSVRPHEQQPPKALLTYGINNGRFSGCRFLWWRCECRQPGGPRRLCDGSRNRNGRSRSGRSRIALGLLTLYVSFAGRICVLFL